MVHRTRARRSSLAHLAAAGMLAAFVPTTGHAADPSQAVGMGATAGAQGGAWTAERMRAALPAPTPIAPPAGDKQAAPTLSASPASKAGNGYRPKVEPVPASSPSELDLDDQAATPSGGSIAPRSVGSSGIPFTTGRVFPNAAVTAYPYRAAGKLFYHNPYDGLDYVCSASTNSPRLIVTAGHCVYQPGKGFFQNFAFVPAYNATLTTQPYGRWTYSYVITTAQWANGGGTVPNVSDFGILVANDQFINGAIRQIGNYIGWFGWQSYALVGNNVTQLGYPSNLDSGGRMEITNSQAVARGSAGEIGSAMGKGASGGPWVQDFGVQAAGQALPGSTGPNRIVGLSSYLQSGGPGPAYYYGSSILNNDFIRIRTTACNRTSGNC